MAYSELVKQFDHIRDYMRDFLIYGYKTREDFAQRSGRTYDNERRRVESWLGDFLRWEYHSGGKAVFFSLDTSELPHNPLHRTWQSKSFTDNDITLHFFLLDLLSHGPARHAEEITDALVRDYSALFDPQTVRRKLREYTRLGVLDARPAGRRLYYTCSPNTLASLFPDPTGLPECLAFFREMAPLSAVGSFLFDRLGAPDPALRWKHHFIVHTLEDQILLAAVQAIHSQSRVMLTNISGRHGRQSRHQVVPAQVMISVQTGRRYLVAWLPQRRRFSTFRLDYTKP